MYHQQKPLSLCTGENKLVLWHSNDQKKSQTSFLSHLLICAMANDGDEALTWRPAEMQGCHGDCLWMQPKTVPRLKGGWNL